MQIVNHCSFKKLTINILLIIFRFHIYLTASTIALIVKTAKNQ